MITPLLLATVIGLGVHAPASNEVIVSVNGQETHVHLAGVPGDSEPGRDFLRCLINKRVVRVDAKRGKVWMLDGTLANDHVVEFLGTRTAADPCAIGRAAYVPQTPPLATGGAAAQTASTPATAATAHPASGKREGHVSFGSSSASQGRINMPLPDQPYQAPPRAVEPTVPAPATPQVYRPQTVQPTTYGTAGTYTPPVVAPTTYGSGSTVTPQTTGTVEPVRPGTVTPPVTKPPV